MTPLVSVNPHASYGRTPVRPYFGADTVIIGYNLRDDSQA